MKNPNVKPSVGKKGVDGKYLVEVFNSAGTRSLGRRFKTEREGKDFFDRTVSAHQQKANREQVSFVVTFYETVSPRSRETARKLGDAKVAPHR